MMLFARAVAVLCWLLACTAQAAETQVAVAANFTAAAKEIADAFQKQTGDKVLLSFGASGAFYTQIVNGAPFAALLSADAERPQRLEVEKIGRPGSRFVYAIGRLVLWSADSGLVDEKGEVLRGSGFRKVAIANPKIAPYGQAAVETLTALGLWDALKHKIVQGESIAQAHQFVATGNAELGFVALAQVALQDTGSKWIVPSRLHAPIEQEAILLKQDAVASRFLDYLKGPQALQIIHRYGYATPGS
jgi:molybdate transport system substrate-binding protein